MPDVSDEEWEEVNRMATLESRKERIYVASSWRKHYQIAVVAACKAAGFEAYDFKDSEGFK